MLTIAVVLNLLTALGIFAMAAKYLTTTPPMDYHAEMLKSERISETTNQIFGAMYKCMGAGFAGLGILVVLLTINGVWNDLFWAKLAVVLGTTTVGGLVALAGRETEQVTSVKTPWRVAAGLSGLGVVAFLVSLI